MYLKENGDVGVGDKTKKTKKIKDQMLQTKQLPVTPPRPAASPIIQALQVPYGTIVSKSGPPTKTTLSTVSRGRLRWRNQTNPFKENLPRAFQFVCGLGQVEGEDHRKPSKQTFLPYVTHRIPKVATSSRALVPYEARPSVSWERFSLLAEQIFENPILEGISERPRKNSARVFSFCQFFSNW